MSPVPDMQWKPHEVVSKPSDPEELILEAWAQGYLVGSLVIMSFITLANMRRGVLLHKLILLELVLGLWQGFWLFFPSPVHAWWLSVSAIFLNASWSLHNVIAWMKIKPFLSKTVSYIFIGTVIVAQAYWIVEIYANFAYFHGVNKIFLATRPYEALCRDPWWILTTIYLFWVIKTQYELSLKEIIRISPRFGIMLLSMLLSTVFIVLDILTVTKAIGLPGPTGINPFWKFAFVFKCLTDSVVLDDFKVALDRLRAFRISRLGSFSGDMSDMTTTSLPRGKRWREKRMRSRMYAARTATTFIPATSHTSQSGRAGLTKTRSCFPTCRSIEILMLDWSQKTSYPVR